MRRHLAPIATAVLLLLTPGLAGAQTWTAPSTWTTGQLVTASDLNTQLRDNMLVLRAGGVTVSSQATGDLLCASSATQFARLADVATGAVLMSGGVGACPSYSSAPTISGIVTGSSGFVVSSLVSTNGNKIVYDGSNILQIGIPGTTSAKKVAFLTSGGSSVATINAVGDAAFTGLLSATGVGQHTVGAGGSGGGSTLIVDGSSASGGGPYTGYSIAGTPKVYVGTESGIIGGTATNAVFYTVSGNGIKFYPNAALAWGMNSGADLTQGTGNNIACNVGVPTTNTNFTGNPNITYSGIACGFIVAATNSGGAFSGSIIINFNHTYANAPSCMAQDYSTTLISVVSATTTTTVTVTTTHTGLGADTFSVHCWGF